MRTCTLILLLSQWSALANDTSYYQHVQLSRDELHCVSAQCSCYVTVVAHEPTIFSIVATLGDDKVSLVDGKWRSNFSTRAPLQVE